MKRASIRLARSEDHPELAKLFLELGVDDAVVNREQFARDMVESTLIAERDGQIAGYAFFRAMRDTAYLSQLVTARHARRSGIGRALMSAVAERSKAAGCSSMALNVLGTNEAAIALYSSFGLERSGMTDSLRMSWAKIDALPPNTTPYMRDVRDVDPADHDRLERATKMMSGFLDDQRGRPGRILRMIENEPGRIAVSIFSTLQSGTTSFRAPDAEHALSLLRAFRATARPDDASVIIGVEQQPALVAALIAAGATLRFSALYMRGRID